MSKDKKWMTLNAHGKLCLWNFIYAISASDIWSTQLDYLHTKELVDFVNDYPDRDQRHPVAGECLTDIGVHTVVHYFPKFDPHLNKFSESLNQKEAK